MGIQLDVPAKADERCEPSAVGEALAPLGLKRNERLVYDALRRSDTPLKAYDLLDHLQEMGVRAPMTIYRALQSLMALGCVKKIVSLNAFVAVGVPRASHAHAFLICRDCAQAKEITLDDRQVAALFAPYAVAVDDVRIEAFGYCHDVCGDRDGCS